MKILKSEKRITHVEHKEVEYLRIRWKETVLWIAIVGVTPIMCSPVRTGILEKLYLETIAKEN